MTVTFDGSMANFFYNGVYTGNSSQYQPRSVIRRTNYIGKSSIHGDSLADAVYDELRIYNRVLTSNEIYSLMNF